MSSACSDNSPTTPTATPQQVDLSGTWNGDLTVSGAAARMTWTLSQTNTSVSGAVIVAEPNGIVLLNGSLSGTIAGSTLTYTIAIGAGAIPAQPQCVGQLGGTMTATLGAPSTLAGDYAVRSSSCTTGLTGGSLSLTRP